MSINSGTGTDHIILALALCACILSAAARAFFSSLCRFPAAAVSQNSRKAVVQQTFSRIFFVFSPPHQRKLVKYTFRIRTLCKRQFII